MSSQDKSQMVSMFLTLVGIIMIAMEAGAVVAALLLNPSQRYVGLVAITVLFFGACASFTLGLIVPRKIR